MIGDAREEVDQAQAVSLESLVVSIRRQEKEDNQRDYKQNQRLQHSTAY